ncbi:MAG TPA: hypothetical protein VFZ61_13915 [Polyangiales bacterium]
MPGKQTAPTPQRATGARGGATKQTQSQPAPAGSTGERDENYALISVLYHALQGAETIDQYIRDARQADDDELADFFEETKQDYVSRAGEAKALLASRIASEDMEEDDEDEEEDEEDEDEDEEE